MKRARRKPEEVVPEACNVWTDATAPGESFTHDQFKERLRTVYGLEPERLRGTRTMTCHVDAQNWHATTYAWDIGGHRFEQFVRQKRDPESMLWWR